MFNKGFWLFSTPPLFAPPGFLIRIPGELFLLLTDSKKGVTQGDAVARPRVFMGPCFLLADIFKLMHYFVTPFASVIKLVKTSFTTLRRYYYVICNDAFLPFVVVQYSFDDLGSWLACLGFYFCEILDVLIWKVNLNSRFFWHIEFFA